MDVTSDLAIASMDPNLPTLDLHGLRRDAVPYEVDMFIAQHPNTCVRIVYGHGKGILKDAVTTFLVAQKQQKIILDFSQEMRGASCILRTK